MLSDEPVVGAVPAIPSKRYFTISEVSTLCNVKPHVLRYWEQEFAVLRPSKRRGNRRYYRREDVLIVSQIKSLLYEQGYTISGARLQIASQRGQSSSPTMGSVSTQIPSEPVPSAMPVNAELIQDLQEVLKILS